MKQETLEEAAHEYFKRGQLGFEKAADTEMAFIKGAKWQQEQDKKMYSEEIIDILKLFLYNIQNGDDVEDIEKWYKQFKNK